jgi:hypothetical protein
VAPCRPRESRVFASDADELRRETFSDGVSHVVTLALVVAGFFLLRALAGWRL